MFKKNLSYFTPRGKNLPHGEKLVFDDNEPNRPHDPNKISEIERV
jgi:hypothetical protein